MASNFDIAVEYILANEGGLSFNPSDNGGITNFGISLRFLKCVNNPKKYGIYDETINIETIKNLTLRQAKDIYLGEFWNHAPFDQLTSQDICNYIFDMSINMGISPATKCLQRALWSLMNERITVIDDGIMGKKTLHYANHYIETILPILRSERAGYYRVIVASNPDQRNNLEGWLNRAYRR